MEPILATWAYLELSKNEVITCSECAAEPLGDLIINYSQNPQKGAIHQNLIVILLMNNSTEKKNDKSVLDQYREPKESFMSWFACGR